MTIKFGFNKSNPQYKLEIHNGSKWIFSMDEDGETNFNEDISIEDLKYAVRLLASEFIRLHKPHQSEEFTIAIDDLSTSGSPKTKLHVIDEGCVDIISSPDDVLHIKR